MGALRRAQKLKAKGSMSAALEAAEEGLRAGPGGDDAVGLHAFVAQCHVLRRDWSAACRHFSCALDEAGEEGIGHPKHAKTLDAEFFYQMGDACFKQGQHQQCVFAYESAMELSTRPKATNLSSVHYQLGVTCVELRELRQAVTHFSKVDKPLQVSLARGDILCEMEACFAGMGETEAGEECMRRATEESMPVRPENIAKVAWFRYQLSGDSDTTLRQLNECLTRGAKTLTKKKQAEVHAMLGRVHLDRREWGDAERHLAMSCKREPDVHNTWLALGELYSATGRDDMAMRALHRCTELDQEAGGAWSMMASMFEKHGQASRAMNIYDRMDPNDPRVKMRQNQILHNAALRLQRIFRGHQARKKMFRNQTRHVARNYGARAPLRSNDAGAEGGEYAQRWELRKERIANVSGVPLARDGGRGPTGRKPLGSSFF